MADAKKRLARGAVILNYARYIKKKWGTDGIAACQKAIGMDGARIAEDGWYPEKVLNDMLGWIAAKYGTDQVMKAAAYTVAGSGMVSFAARVAGIRSVLERGEEDYKRNFNYGELKVKMEEKRAIVTMTDAAHGEVDCIAWQGALQGAVDMCKRNGKVVQTECKFKGGKACVYEMTWS
jgi:hypothetical protein